MPNVLILGSALNTGGAERVIAHLVRHLDRSRFNVTVGHLMNRGKIGEELADAGYDVVGVPRERPLAKRYLSFYRLDRVVRERKIDLIHSHTAYALADAALGQLSNWRGARLVHTFHFGNYPHMARRYLVLEAFGARAADRLVAVGTRQAEAIRSALRLRGDALQVIANGAELGSAPINCEWQRRLKETGAVIVGTICTFIEQKGLPDLVRVADACKRSGAKMRFVVVGDGPLRAGIEHECRRLVLDDYVFFTGMIDQASSSMLPSFDVFFQPSLWEAMSVVVVEAMAARKPVVATDVGDNRRVIEDGVSGRVVPPRDVPAMVSALRELVDDVELRRQMGDAGHERYSQHFTVATMVREYENLYEGVLRS